MKLLIDTHCWLWWLSDPGRLNKDARHLLANGNNVVYFSAASSWEIAIKSALGKLELPETPEQYVPRKLASQSMKGLAIEHIHALRVASLPDHHKDPFDRLIIAQAQVEGLRVLSVDPQMTLYDIELIWAGTSSRPS